MTATLTLTNEPRVGRIGPGMRDSRNGRARPEVLPGFARLLERAQQGDEAALTQIYRAYNPQLQRYLRVCAAGVAEDLASEVWLAVATRLRLFEGEEAGFRAWLFTVARRRVIDHRRREGRRRTDPVDAVSLASRPGWVDTEMEVMDSLGTEDALALVARVLTPEQAEVVILRIVVGLSVAEVAELVGRQEVTVRVMQHRALERLAQRLQARTRSNELTGTDR
jgi:RNA polymerase sigma-70 factor, ECF subfamily